VETLPRFAQGPISPRPPAHRHAPQARGRSPHHPPSVHAIPTACTSTTRHGGEGVLAHGRTGTRAQGREVTRWLSNNNKKHEPQRQAPSASCHLTPTHMRTHTHTHTVGKAKVSVLAEVGWTNHWELPYLPPRVEGRGGGVCDFGCDDCEKFLDAVRSTLQVIGIGLAWLLHRYPGCAGLAGALFEQGGGGSAGSLHELAPGSGCRWVVPKPNKRRKNLGSRKKPNSFL